jgi:hypothetical protein
MQSAAIVGVLIATVSLMAANSFEVTGRNIVQATTGAEISIRADLDQDIYGFSVSLNFDPDDITITSVRLGSAVSPLEPEFSAGVVDNETGQFSHGVVFALSEDRINTRLQSADDLEVLVLVVDVSNTPGSTTIDLANGNTPGRLNVMTDGQGNSVSPGPSLNDGTINIIDMAPRMDTFLNNSGGSGTVFTIVGSNFEQPDLTVRVCGNDAEYEVLANGQSLQVTAPRCAVVGPAQVEVCTVRGCARDSNGFNYTVADIAPIITSVISNSGRAGTIFFADARNLNDPAAITVKVCGVDADFRVLPGGAILTTLQITAPDCGSGGWSELEICNAFGCDTLTEGFDYDVVGGRFLPGDCNSDGSLDLSDGVCLLSHLFVGRPAELPCEGASAARMNDYNGDSNVDLSDGVAVLIYLFQGGSPHAEGIQCKVVAGCPNACN